ncbi:MAG TPA: hypothetical protein VHZ24_07645 [Pirellulales bacterium]|jgi:hypothetical protein|nr:hypothetical protein [Pirellulales bacterium]
MRKVFCFSVAVVVMLAASLDSATAADKKYGPEQVFKMLDKDRNRKLSVKEFVGRQMGEESNTAKEKFKRLDSNNDDALTLEEFKASRYQRFP